MTTLGLGEWTFGERDPVALRDRMNRLNTLDEATSGTISSARARQALRREFAWDDYWPRVIERIGERAACA